MSIQQVTAASVTALFGAESAGAKQEASAGFSEILSHKESARSDSTEPNKRTSEQEAHEPIDREEEQGQVEQEDQAQDSQVQSHESVPLKNQILTQVNLQSQEATAVSSVSGEAQQQAQSLSSNLTQASSGSAAQVTNMGTGVIATGVNATDITVNVVAQTTPQEVGVLEEQASDKSLLKLDPNTKQPQEQIASMGKVSEGSAAAQEATQLAALDGRASRVQAESAGTVEDGNQKSSSLGSKLESHFGELASKASSDAQKPKLARPQLEAIKAESESAGLDGGKNSVQADNAMKAILAKAQVLSASQSSPAPPMPQASQTFVSPTSMQPTVGESQVQPLADGQSSATQLTRTDASPAGVKTLSVPKEGPDFQSAQKLFRMLRQNIRQGGSELKIRIDPPHLGQIEVEVNQQAGKLDIHMQVDNESIRELVQKHLENLRTTLENYGYGDDELNLNLSSGEGQDDLQKDDSQQFSKPGAWDEEPESDFTGPVLVGAQHLGGSLDLKL